MGIYRQQSSKIRIEPDTIMVSGFSGEHSSPLQYCLINFVGAFCECPLKQCCYPINQAIYYGCGYTVDNDRSCNGEHLCADAEDEAFCLCQLRTQCFLSKPVKIFRNRSKYCKQIRGNGDSKSVSISPD